MASILALCTSACRSYILVWITPSWLRVFLSVLKEDRDFLRDRDGNFMRSAICYGFFAREVFRLRGVSLVLPCMKEWELGVLLYLPSFIIFIAYNNTMDRDKLESKLKALSLKNKKLLESISTHLISNPDELEGRLHEHRFLEQKYNELIGFSRDSVEKYEKMQAALSLK